MRLAILSLTAKVKGSEYVVRTTNGDKLAGIDLFRFLLYNIDLVLVPMILAACD